ncbi:hypothetical protein Tco_0290663 [Tanacetum coccineum]
MVPYGGGVGGDYGGDDEVGVGRIFIDSGPEKSAWKTKLFRRCSGGWRERGSSRKLLRGLGQNDKVGQNVVYIQIALESDNGKRALDVVPYNQARP